MVTVGHTGIGIMCISMHKITKYIWNVLVKILAIIDTRKWVNLHCCMLIRQGLPVCYPIYGQLQPLKCFTPLVCPFFLVNLEYWALPKIMSILPNGQASNLQKINSGQKWQKILHNTHDHACLLLLWSTIMSMTAI